MEIVKTENESIEPKKIKRVAIVVQETGEGETGEGFNFFMEGDTEALKAGEIDPSKLSPAEFWGMTIFQIGIQVLTEAGVIKTITKPQ